MKHANVAIFVPHLGCPQRCSFCDQRTISGEEAPPTASFVTQTCEQALQNLGDAARQAEIAFFGGSFTAIERGYMVELLQAARPFVGVGKFRGIRVSTRPDAISAEVLVLLKQYGVTAIELGAQSLDDAVLEKNQRGHTAKDVDDAVEQIKRYGFSLGLQMMVGLYGDSKESLYQTTQKIIAHRPDTVRIYPTVILKNTKLAQLLQSGEYIPMTLEESVCICSELLHQFEQNGIRVIRLGLHDSEQLKCDRVGGAYHPAFRELCENRLFFKLAVSCLKGCEKGAVTLFVNPRSISKLIGQRRSNIEKFAQMGYDVTVRAKEEIPDHWVTL